MSGTIASFCSQIESVDLAPGDYINIRDGPDAGSTLITQLTGSGQPSVFISTGPQVYLFFKSQSLVISNTGFKLRYKTGNFVLLLLTRF